MPKTDYLEDTFLNHALRGIDWTSPATVYCILYTVVPTDAGGGTEVSGGSYARQAVTFGVPDVGRTANSVDVIFPIATADWGDIVAYGVIDALTGGNLLYWANLNAAYPIHVTDQWKFPAGSLLVIED